MTLLEQPSPKCRGPNFLDRVLKLSETTIYARVTEAYQVVLAKPKAESLASAFVGFVDRVGQCQAEDRDM